MNITRFLRAGALMFALAGIGFAQTGEVNTAPGRAANRRIIAVKYNENKQTTVTMSGTVITSRVAGKAQVEYKQGRARIRLEMAALAHPQSLGGFYTTYVLWAVAPEGQAESLVELPVQKSFKIEATTKFQTFGLIITAEPHSRVELPGSMIVAENTLRKETEGGITTSKIEYSGDPGTIFAMSPLAFPPATVDYTTPLMILGARRAVEIAQRADAARFAGTGLQDAEQKLALLEQAWPRSRKPSDLRDNAKKNSGLAHDVMRIAEQARKLSVERSHQAGLDAERQRAGNNIAQAQAAAERARTEAARARASERAQVARAGDEAVMAKDKIEQAQADTAQAKANEGQARNEADKARLETAVAKVERDAAQQRLYVSLAEILETRREARGLIVNLSDVLFDTGKTTLKPGAREKLSKLAGLLAAYAGACQIEIEGHTDSVGAEKANLNLSRGRAEAVRDYLLGNGVQPERLIAARGLGETKPVAGNETAAGRQVNRRVEIIISDYPVTQTKAGQQQ